jgi:hypothetical protein
MAPFLMQMMTHSTVNIFVLRLHSNCVRSCVVRVFSLSSGSPLDSLLVSASNDTGYPQRVQENEGFANQSNTEGGSVGESLQGLTALPKHSSKFAYVVTPMVKICCSLLWC